MTDGASQVMPQIHNWMLGVELIVKTIFDAFSLQRNVEL